MKTNYVKKLFAGVISLALIIALFGCERTNPPIEPSDSPTTVSPEPTVEITTATPPEKKELQHGNTASNLINGGYIAEYDDYLFFANADNVDHSSIFRLNIKTNEIIQLSDTAYGSLNIYNDKLYYSVHDIRNIDIGDPSTYSIGIFACDFGGKSTTQIYDDMWLGFSIVGDSIYFAERHQSGSLFRLDLNTDEVVQITDMSSSDINITADKIYYIRGVGIEHMMLDGSDNGLIYQCNLDGSESEVLLDGYAYNLVAEGDYLYYIHDEDYHYYLERMDIKTRECERLSDTEYTDFNIYKGKIYCSDDGRIDILDLDGNMEKRYEIEGLIWGGHLQAAGNWIFFRQLDSWIYRIDTTTDIIDVLFEYADRSQELPITPGQKLNVTTTPE
ncbi:MAG: DUF5050 domain-containing protein [Oscillospiraceae bacterium]|jgi:hypothetical protein|nr:DUF5050 domain-containing protein [Oscillospiraceae bacterium]